MKAVNIGAHLAEKLQSIGINSIEELEQSGSQNTILKIAKLENSGVCINMLYAIEGAIQGIRWHNLTREKKLALKDFYCENFEKRTI